MKKDNKKQNIIPVFTNQNRINLNKKINLGTKEKPNVITCKDQLERMQGKLSDYETKKREGKYTLQGVSLESLIDTQKATIKTFLEENKIYPSPKGFEILRENLFNSTTQANTPIQNIDYVLSDEQEKIKKAELSNDKVWSQSKEGQQEENSFAKTHLSKGNVGKRQFRVGMKNGIPTLAGAYMVHAEYDEELETAFNNRIKAKKDFIGEQVKQKQLVG